MQFQHLLDPVSALARQAGEAILEVYNGPDFGVTNKDDDSPLTQADLASHRIIVAGLNDLDPEIPVLSEESAAVGWERRRQWSRYWLVDPLDGTREFIKRNDEFTVNIALIDNGVPVLGVVYAPVLDWLYRGAAGAGAVKQCGDDSRALRGVRVRAGQKALKVIASRSHRGEVLEDWLESLRADFPELALVSMGSSLKFCLLAEGAADIYPRLSPTSEWDTAAAQAVLEAAGGALLELDGSPYRYNRKESLLNPDFIAVADASFRGWPAVHAGTRER